MVTKTLAHLWQWFHPNAPFPHYRKKLSLCAEACVDTEQAGWDIAPGINDAVRTNFLSCLLAFLLSFFLSFFFFLFCREGWLVFMVLYWITENNIIAVLDHRRQGGEENEDTGRIFQRNGGNCPYSSITILALIRIKRRHCSLSPGMKEKKKKSEKWVLWSQIWFKDKLWEIAKIFTLVFFFTLKKIFICKFLCT